MPHVEAAVVCECITGLIYFDMSLVCANYVTMVSCVGDGVSVEWSGWLVYGVAAEVSLEGYLSWTEIDYTSGATSADCD